MNLEENFNKAVKVIGEGPAYVVNGTLKRIKSGENHQEAFNRAAEDENFHGMRSDVVASRKKITDYLKSHHKVKVDHVHKFFHESVELKQEETIELVNDIISGNSIDIDNSFEAIMSAKIAERLEDFRKEVAQGMFTESTEELSDDQIVEDILALDELSKETLKNYLDKSVFNHTKRTTRSVKLDHGSDNSRKIANRVRGITTASNKLTKEQKEIIESVLEEFQSE
jgi:hypothetical protein